MDQNFLDKMRDMLKKQREDILASLSDQTDDMRELVKTVESGDEADVAADAIDRTLLTALGSQDAVRLQAIDGALERIYKGKFGYCISCGNEIPEARLEILPYSTMCVKCQAAQERRNR